MPVHFSYGSNMDVAAMQVRCPHARLLGPAQLAGWRYFVAASGYGSLRRSEGAVTHGMLWRLDRDGLEALDDYEDVAGGLYRRIRLFVATTRGARPALVYLTRDTTEGVALPGYQEAMLAAAAQCRLPVSARRRLRRWAPRL